LFQELNLIWNPSLEKYPRLKIERFKIVQISIKKIFILILAVGIFGNFSFIDSYAENYATKILEIRCIHMYEKFKIMGEDNLRKRYPAKTILNSCLNLYNDPQWTFEGKNLIDEKFPSEMKDKLNSRILSYAKIGPTKYLVKFQICSEVAYKSRYLLITTDQEQFIGAISRPNYDSCVSFWSLMRTENPHNVKFSWQYSDISNFQNLRKLM